MPTAHLYLTDGFRNDHVVVRIDGHKVFDESGVTTQKLYGLAKQLPPVTVASDQARVEIALPDKGYSKVIDVDLSRGHHVPVSIENGQLTVTAVKNIGFA